MTSRRPLLILVAALAIVAAAATAYWFHAAATLRKSLDDWATRLATQGGQAEWDGIETSGFPLRIELTLSAPRLTVNGIGWQGERLVAGMSAFDPGQIGIRAPGRHHLRAAAGELELVAGQLAGNIRIDLSGRIDEARIEASDVAANGWRAGRVVLALAPLTAQTVDHQTPTLAATLSAGSVALPQGQPSLLAPTIEAIELAATWKGTLPADLRPRSLRAWADDGGTVELSKAAIAWDKVALDGEGTLALDPAGQPLAALSTRVRGLPVLMEQLAENGLMEPSAANALKFILMMMSKPDAQGRPAIAVPVTLQDGNLYLGPALLTQIPPITWPEE